MRRWTDGKSWSASRVSGSFLTYREMEGKRGGGQFVPPPLRRSYEKTPDSVRGSDEDLDMDGEGPDGYRYKPDGLMKQSFSITTSTGQHLHLISYYSRPHPGAPQLPMPTTDPQLRHIVPVKGMYLESTVHETEGPAVTRAPMQHSPHIQHQPEQSPHRGDPPPPYGYHQPGYSWPPSPYQHHSPHMTNGHIPNGMIPHPQSAFDRPPPSLSDSSLPPPPPPPQSRGMSTATAANLMPSFAPNPSPRIAQARLVTEQEAQLAQRALQVPSMLEPRLAAAQISLPPIQVNEPPRTPTPPQNTSQPKSQSQPSTPTGARSSPKDTPKADGSSQAQSIPSISDLVHATDSVSVISKNKSNSSRTGSKSTKASNGDNQRPTDIRRKKLSTVGEDQRAIRVLDKKFMI